MKPMRGFGYDEHHEYYLSGTSDFQSVEILEVTVHCNYELTLFPFDYQECDFSLFELRNDVDSVILKEFVLFYKSHLNVKNLPQQYGIPYEIAMKSSRPRPIHYQHKSDPPIQTLSKSDPITIQIPNPDSILPQFKLNPILIQSRPIPNLILI